MKGKIKNIRSHLNEATKKFLTEKFPEKTVCKKCHIIFSNGKWVWDANLYDKLKKNNEIKNEIICPVCEQISNNEPLGYLYIKKELVKNKLDEIKNLINNLEKNEIKKSNFHKRFMGLKFEDNNYIITNTKRNFFKKMAVK
ncbi:hypothetical protein J7L48_00865, partial [bacterium]|nr:hypothetical protein [bacterium]